MSYEESSSSSSFYQNGAGVNGFSDGMLLSQIFNESSRNNHSCSSYILGGYGAAQGNYSSYESASSAGYGAGANNAFLAGSGGAGSEYYSSSTYGGVGGGFQGSSSGYGASFEQQGVSGASLAGNASYNFSSSEQQASGATVYATDAQGLFKDPNPQVIRRPAAGGVQTFTQRVVVRFLQPPPVPPPGVSRSMTSSLTQQMKCLFFPIILAFDHQRSSSTSTPSTTTSLYS